VSEETRAANRRRAVEELERAAKALRDAATYAAAAGFGVLPENMRQKADDV
jgi:sugar phosphate isomerase/epimerase